MTNLEEKIQRTSIALHAERDRQKIIDVLNELVDWLRAQPQDVPTPPVAKKEKAPTSDYKTSVETGKPWTGMKAKE